MKVYTIQGKAFFMIMGSRVLMVWGKEPEKMESETVGYKGKEIGRDPESNL